MTALLSIPFNRPSLRGHELDYIAPAMACDQIAGDQTFSRKSKPCSNKF